MHIFIRIGFEEGEDQTQHVQVHKPDGTVEELTAEQGATVIDLKPGEAVTAADLGVIAT